MKIWSFLGSFLGRFNQGIDEFVSFLSARFRMMNEKLFGAPVQIRSRGLSRDPWNLRDEKPL